MVFKKSLASIFAVVTVFGASAQLSLGNGGQVRVGQVPETEQEATDSLASMVILPSKIDHKNARVTFGEGHSAGITLDSETNILSLYSAKGIELRSLGQSHVKFSDFADFNADVVAMGFRVKSNPNSYSEISELKDCSGLWEITPVLLKGETEGTDADGVKESLKKAEQENRTLFGFLAEEIREVYPSLVQQGSDGSLSVDYIGLIPVMVKAIKELKEQNEALKEDIISLSQGGQPKKVMASLDEIAGENVQVLSQNRPNPFTSRTVIDCVIPNDSKDATIRIYDLQGNQIVKIPVSNRGKVSVEVDGSQLKAGMYIYSLIVDDKDVATKRMVVTD